MLLSVILFLPLVFALVLAFMPGDKMAKPMALAFASIEFLLSLILLFEFDPSTASLQFVEKYNWVKSSGISYFLGVDGISIWLIILTTFLTPLTILGAWNSIHKRTKTFLIAMFVLEATMLGTFMAMDAILFYCFFEASLIPMYLMIGIWGGTRRIYATMKFFIYTMAGSVFMLLSIIALMFITEAQLGQMSSSLLDFYKLDLPFIAGEFLTTQTLLFFGFALAFAIKVPIFPFHTWLPDAHVEAPTPGSVVLAGVMLKMGTYGLIRFVIPMFPEATEYWAWIFLLVGAFGIVYGALVAMVQSDMKKLVAYSSVSHMGYVIIGMFALNTYGIGGSIYQMLNHGISTGALFLLVGMIYDRTHSREISKYGGLAPVAPIFTILFIIVTMSSIAVPMTNGFVGEFMILMGTYLSNKWYAIVAVTGVVLGAAYMLWMVKRVFFGTEGEIVTKYKETGLDLNTRELVVMAPLIILIFWMGLFPNHFLDYSKTSIDHLANNKNKYELTIKDSAELNKVVQVKAVKE